MLLAVIFINILLGFWFIESVYYKLCDCKQEISYIHVALCM